MARRKHFELKGGHGHNKGIEMAVVILCLACIVFTIIAIQAL
ncbi:MAG: hypothetical protein OXL98_09030 [Acidimicrobiaceae bacterium]|nr:hypothetical protein [Acidimicrobiaceae bacterium]